MVGGENLKEGAILFTMGLDNPSERQGKNYKQHENGGMRKIWV